MIQKKNKSVYFFPANIGHAYITLSKKNHMIYGTSGNYEITEEYKLPFNKNLLRIIIVKKKYYNSWS